VREEPRFRDRSRGREAALQMLYQWEVGGGDLQDVLTSFWGFDPARVGEEGRAFAETLVRGVVRRLEEIDALIAGVAENWRLTRMAVLDRSILRLAVNELLSHPETPPKVVINEALELAKRFSGDEATGFVNGVLDAVRKQLQNQSEDP